METPRPASWCLDIHVHLHPPRLAEAIQRHFAREGWVTAHSFEPAAVAETLAARGVDRFCYFSYAHKPGIARSLNEWTARTAASLPGAIPLGTLHPADPDLTRAAAEALEDLGLAGFKFHFAVQRIYPDDRRLYPVYERAEAEGRVLVVHVGTAPYRDPYTGIARFRRVMARFPRLRVCVAHMGAWETDAFLELIDQHSALYVDTTMALAPAAERWVGIRGGSISDGQLLRYQDRILFGSDFPLIPYDYDEERRWAWERGLPPEVQRKIFRDNALRFLGRTG